MDQMLYRLARSLLFSFEPEKAHHIAFKILETIDKVGALGVLGERLPNNPVNTMGISFPNRIGLAAGLDKNGAYLDVLGKLGFGFIEIGTVTPEPQDGNAKPRLFRISPCEALINRLGFNNLGAVNVANNLNKSKYKGILGINIGKNADTPISQAHLDYKFCLQKLYELGDYFTINISSPNTQGLRELQKKILLDKLLAEITHERDLLAEAFGKKKPLVIKVSPDLDMVELHDLTHIIKHHSIDGIIATNTTLSRDYVEGFPHSQQAGGLSGKPLFSRSTNILKKLHQSLGKSSTLIGVGGITSAEDAVEKFQSGAQLIQLYTGLIYQGPGLLKKLAHIKP